MASEAPVPNEVPSRSQAIVSGPPSGSVAVTPRVRAVPGATSITPEVGVMAEITGAASPIAAVTVARARSVAPFASVTCTATSRWPFTFGVNVGRAPVASS